MPKTGFKPEKHGFAFVNSWKFDKGETQEMRQTLTGSLQGATKNTESGVGGVGGMVLNRLSGQMETWIENAMPDYYGMCGGMAFTAADYFHAKQPLPRGLNYNDIPQDDSPRSQALRDYLWKRQLQSLQINAHRLLQWMLMLHIPLPFAGPGWVLDRTREEWAELKGYIDQGKPWPLCLIGSSASPFNNHQVLAVGYDELGENQGIIYVYDMNDPGKEQTIKLDMRGDVLQAEESVPNQDRGPLRGFFCENYTPAPVPNLPE